MRVTPPESDANRGTPHAGELFTDRESESRAFKAALARFRCLLDEDEEVGIARQNVLTFYGLGGIGKTALSERLEAWVRHDLPLVNGWGPAPATNVDATARIDLHGSAGRINMLATLLALRAGAGRIRRRWPLFDLAFTAYWSAVRPGEALPRFRGGEEYGDLVAETAGELLKDLGSMADLTVGAPAGVGVWSVRKVIAAMRHRHDLRFGAEAFAGFESFLLRCADEPSPTESRPALACEIAATLSWELATMTPSPLLVVFVDTTERLALDPRRVSEGHLNRLVHDMPNVLFVLAGRERLDWHEESRADLPFRGPWTWPGLIPGAQEISHQHSVGNLTQSDTRALILRGRAKLDLPMTDDVVEELVYSSAGLPQYLELALQVALNVRRAGDGRTVRIEDVTGSLASLVTRVLDDVPADEQRAIRAACLFRIFDTRLIAAAADVDHGCAERAVTRPMIDYHEGERFPYRMHDAVREAVRRAGHQVVGGWTEHDWELAATRAAAAAHRLHDDAKEREDNREVLDAIVIAVELVCEQNTALEQAPNPASYADWLSRAIVYSPSVQGFHSRMPAESRTEYGRHVLSFIAAKSLETPIDERVKLLREVSGTDHPLRRAAARHLGYTLKILCRWDEALDVFDALSAEAPIELHLGQRPQLLNLTRHFLYARDAAAALAVKPLITRVREYSHGRPERYFTEIGDKIDKYRRTGRQREYLEEYAVLISRRAFFHEEVTDDIERLRDEAELAGHVLAIRCLLLATILLPRTAPPEREFALQRLKTLDQASGADGSIGFRYAFAECCSALVHKEPDRVARLRVEILAAGYRTSHWIPVECFLAEAGHPLQRIPTQWFEPAATVQERWAGHLRTYLARHQAARKPATSTA